MAYSISGFVRDSTNEVITTECYYQFYFLKQHSDVPIKMSELRKKLPKQVMYPTLKIILDYLWKSGKIMFGPKGVQWIYSEPEHLKKMMKGALEV